MQQSSNTCSIFLRTTVFDCGTRSRLLQPAMNRELTVRRDFLLYHWQLAAQIYGFQIQDRSSYVTLESLSVSLGNSEVRADSENFSKIINSRRHTRLSLAPNFKFTPADFGGRSRGAKSEISRPLNFATRLSTSETGFLAT